MSFNETFRHISGCTAHDMNLIVADTFQLILKLSVTSGLMQAYMYTCRPIAYIRLFHYSYLTSRISLFTTFAYVRYR